MAKKQKFYVVWDGAEDGVYTSWEACKEAVSGYSNAKYKAFKSEEEAEEAFEMGYEEWKKRNESCEAEKDCEAVKDDEQTAKMNEIREAYYKPGTGLTKGGYKGVEDEERVKMQLGSQRSAERCLP